MDDRVESCRDLRTGFVSQDREDPESFSLGRPDCECRGSNMRRKDGKYLSFHGPITTKGKGLSSCNNSLSSFGARGRGVCHVESHANVSKIGKVHREQECIDSSCTPFTIQVISTLCTFSPSWVYSECPQSPLTRHHTLFARRALKYNWTFLYSMIPGDTKQQTAPNLD